MVKGGAPPNDTHAVDAISGGTITSHGVQNMLYDILVTYKPFFEKQKK
ncbi:MAG TPA: FMN-binding protein [Bacteroidales bacterium]|nr:FMN-binding protein [Bacteroidales bacterium]